MAGVVESYYLETCEGLFFAVKGMEHPPDRVISIVRYAPDPKGLRTKNGVAYRRLYRFDEQELLLQSSYPQYLSYDPIFRATLQGVPKSRIRRVHDPRLRLEESAENSAAGIEADAVSFTGLLQKEAGIPRNAVGVTGSLLIGLHASNSDLDIAVFGSTNCLKVYEALGPLREPPSEVRRLDAKEINELYLQRVADTPMPFDEFARREGDKVCQGSFHGRPYFIRFIRGAAESGLQYGSVQYTPLGRANISATIADSKDAIFTPCRYTVSDARIVEGLPVPISEIVSFRGRFCEQARPGEFIEASGTVERMENSAGEVRYRLLLGNTPGDTMLART